MHTQRNKHCKVFVLYLILWSNAMWVEMVTLIQQHVLFCGQQFQDILNLGKNFISLILKADINLNMKYKKYLTQRICKIHKIKFKKNLQKCY